MKNSSKLVVAFAAATTLFASAPAQAQSQTFDKNHPRRAEVIHRTKAEKGKNNSAYANGKITGNQDRKLNHEDNQIRKQEQRQAARNGGYITKGQQAKDNREENAVNRQRNADERRDAR